MDQNSAGLAGTSWLSIHLWSFWFERSQFNYWLLPNGTAGKFVLYQHMQPIGCSADRCILAVKESCCQEYNSTPQICGSGNSFSRFWSALRLLKKQKNWIIYGKLKYCPLQDLLKKKTFTGMSLSWKRHCLINKY